MSANSTHSGSHEPLIATEPSPASPILVNDAAENGRPQESKSAADFKENGLPFTDDFIELTKTKAIEDKMTAGEALVVEDFQHLMKDNGASEAHKDESTKATDAEAIINMFIKQSKIMEKYTKHLETLGKEAEQPEAVEAVTAMVEQTHIQTEAIVATVEKEEDDFPEELQHQLETALSQTEEALERLMGKLKRKAAAGQAPAKAAVPEIPTSAGSVDSKV
ncbi:MAG: hypothetical protein Q9221_001365 [Calogaya cf. arnoldii]